MFRLVGFLLFIGILAGSQAYAEDEQDAVPAPSTFILSQRW